MRELSTAHLAGGTTPRPTGAPVGTRDPMPDTRESQSATTEVGSTGTGVDTRDTTPPPPSTPHRTSQLANPAATDGAASDDAPSLFPAGEAEQFKTRWVEVQTGFVDEPRHAVEQADSLVAEMMKRLAQVFADERARLEEQWSRGDDIGTEDLRQALRRYRSFFDRLLSV
jgi:hypothetical protein